jgi:peptide/nickel transport system ATP-binding protein
MRPWIPGSGFHNKSAGAGIAGTEVRMQEKKVTITNSNEAKDMDTPLLEVTGLTSGFIQEDKRILSAVNGVSFTLRTGETLGLVGESGSGKSVTSLSLMRLLGNTGRIQSGTISFNGLELTGLSPAQMRKIRGKDIAMIFQDPMVTLNPVLTIGQHLTEPLRIHLGMNKREARERAVELLRLVGFARTEEIVDEFPHQLSGGMCQRVMIAIAVACNPKLLIADEPTTALDVTIQAQILELLQKIQQESNTAILFITHDLAVVAETCKRVIVMYAGTIVEEAPVGEIFEHPLHPYTIGLLKSLPQWEERRGRLYSIPGMVPSPGQVPAGCCFNNRCTFASDRCRSEKPPFLDVAASHRVGCWNTKPGQDNFEFRAQ